MRFISILFLLFLTSFVFADDFVIDEPTGTKPAATPSPQTQQQNQQVVSPTLPVVGTYTPFIGTVPTPDNLNRGQFNISFSMYDNGGVNTRILVGIFDILSIGLSENFDGLIGAQNINVNIPGAFMKLTILKDNAPIDWAVGFDSFAYGKNGTYYDTNNNPATIYGFYTTAGWHYSLLGGKDNFVFGLRIPLLPSEYRDLTNSTLFIGATANIGNYLVFGLSLENIYVTFNRQDQILPSFSITLKPISQFQLTLDVQYEIYSSTLSRIFSLGYQASF